MDSSENAQKYFSLHAQPRISLNDNYYALSDCSGVVWKWQVELAKNTEYMAFSYIIIDLR